MATKPKENQKTPLLKRSFMALVDRKMLNLDLDVLKVILQRELLIDFHTLSEDLVAVIPFMLVLYMKSWPGWQRSKEYFSGKLVFKEWYEKFRQYIVIRLNFLIQSGYNSVLTELQENEQSPALQEFAPFHIAINCPPSFMNSMNFADKGDNIVIHKLPNFVLKNKIDINQLLNWPHVEIEFLSPELKFSRKNCSEYKRYLDFTGRTTAHQKTEYIEKIEIINPSLERNCYTLNFLNCYVKEYMNVLKSVKDIEPTELYKIQIILNEFLKDVEEIDMNNTIATNTSVLFNIGRGTFHRNSAVRRNPTVTSVNYCELIIPKMETSLLFFEGLQDMSTPNVSFTYLNFLKCMLKNNNCKTSIGVAIPRIIYRCNFCNLRFDSDSEILNHLESYHKMEFGVLCVLCNVPYSISFLSNVRWKHTCNETNANS